MSIFNVRVYGILIENDSVLVSEEVHGVHVIIKFPGGGLEFGESTHECLRREYMEELQLEIDIVDHFYTVDFFQVSAFDPTQQVISIYYLVKNNTGKLIKVTNSELPLPNSDEDVHAFRWVPLISIDPEEFTFPIDQKVGTMLSDLFKARKYKLS